MQELWQLLAPPEKISTADWAEKYRYLPDTAAEGGKYHLDRTPALIGILEAIDDPDIPMIVCMKSAQVGWTDGVINNYIGKRIDTDPCGIITMFPKEGQAKEFESEKFRPMVECTPKLRGRVDLSIGRRDGNRALFKKFPGGFLKLVGSNSPSSVKSTAAPVNIIEEPDDTNANVKGQGNSIKLLMERSKTFADSKIIYGGTPTLDGLSEVQQAYELSDQRKLYVPCHECGSEHVLDFDNLMCPDIEGRDHPVYGSKDPDAAFYACPDCGAIWSDYDRINNVLQAAESNNWQTHAESRVAGFYINELYSSFAGSRHANLMKKWLEAKYQAAKGNIEDLIAFVNSSMGKPFQFESDAPEVDQLAARALDYPEMVVPNDGLILTAGVDFQHDRIAIIIRAWGCDEESWLVCWREIHGNVQDRNDPVWLELERLLFSPIQHESGRDLMISAMSWDSSDGNTNDNVYFYVRQWSAKYKRAQVMAIKGASDPSREIFSTPRQSIDANAKNTKAYKYGLRPFIVGVEKAKDLISGRLKMAGKGPGRMHFYEEVRPDYYEQLTSEVKAPHRSRRGVMTWQKKSGVRNEALDCEVYALHASRAAKVHLIKPAQWKALAAKLSQSDMFVDEAEEAEIADQKRKKPARKRRKDSYLTSYKS